MQGLQEEAREETGRRMGREMRKGRIQPLSFILSPPPQPHCMNGAVHIPHAAPFSLLSPLVVPFIIITYYIICIIRMQYNLFCFYINCNLKIGIVMGLRNPQVSAMGWVYPTLTIPVPVAGVGGSA